jgi:hypothetical protein
MDLTVSSGGLWCLTRLYVQIFVKRATVSSTNKTELQDITETLLKKVLNTINHRYLLVNP